MLLKLTKLKNFIGPKVFNYFWISIACGLFSFAIESSFVLILQGFLVSINLLEVGKTFLPAWYPTSVMSSVVLLLFFAVLRATSLALKSHSSELTRVTFICEQREFLFSHGLRNASSISNKEIISTFSEVVSQAGVAIGYLSVVINTAVTSALLLGLGFKLAPFEMGIGAILLAIVLLPMKLANGFISKSGKNILDEWEKINNSLSMGLKNNFLLHVYRKIEAEIQNGHSYLNKYKKIYLEYSIISGVLTGFPLVAGVFVLCVMIFTSVNYIHTEPMKLLSFFYVFIRLAQAASETRGNYSNITLNKHGILKLFSIKESYLQHPQPAHRESVDFDEKNLSLICDNISFKFPNSKALFSNLNFNLVPGDVLVIKGESGVGKSTLLSVILGLRTPSSGRILINNIDQNKFSLNYHDTLGYVGPEPFLIQGSIIENLMYGQERENFDESQYWNVLKKVELDEIIRNLPGGLNEQVFDIPQFSTGQKQRLSFARALLRQPRILILDEATANLDIETEKRMIANIKHNLNECIAIIVTHKNSFDGIATQSIVLG